MDPRDFDSLARSAANGLSRRRVMAWLGVGGAASVMGAPSVALAQSRTSCTLPITGTVRLGPSAGLLLFPKSTTPGEISGELTFTPGENGEIDNGEFRLPDGKKLDVVGQVVGRSVNLRVTLQDKRVVVLIGTAAEDLDICKGAVDGLLTGPEPGDIGDWHATAKPGRKTTNSTGSSSNSSGSSGGNSNGNGGGGCKNGQGDCGNGCIDLLADPKNCGACDSTCGIDELCVGGTCVGGGEGCPEGQIACGDMGCIDPANDPNNCGGCGTACEETLICINGGCCLADEVCDGVCTNVLADPMNCGACGTVCQDGETCDGGGCVGACPDGQILCGGECATLGVETSCTGCDDVCGGDQVCCGEVGCIDILFDNFNCGACFNECAENENCDNGTCVVP